MRRAYAFMLTSTKPSSLGTSDNVDYLFPDFKEVEKEYLKKTNIHPIMHVVAVKRCVLDQNPWLARSLVKAFSQSMEYAYEAIFERGALRYILPWLEDHVRETKECVRTMSALSMSDAFLQGFRDRQMVGRRLQGELPCRPEVPRVLAQSASSKEAVEA